MMDWKSLLNEYLEEQSIDIKVLREGFVLIAMVVGIILFIYLVGSILVPHAVNVHAQWTDLQEAEAEVQRIERKLSVLNSLDKEQMKALIARSEQLLPSSQNIASVLSRLGEAEQISGASVLGYSVLTQQRKSDKYKSEYGIRFQIAGTLSQINNYLRVLQSQEKRILELTEIVTVSATETSNEQENLYKTEVSARVFYAPLPVEIVETEKDVAILSTEERRLLERIASLPARDYFEPSETEIEFTPRVDPFTSR